MARAGVGLQIAGGDPPPPAMTHSTHKGHVPVRVRILLRSESGKWFLVSLFGWFWWIWGFRMEKCWDLGLEDIVWQANLRMNESFEGGPYPERLGQPDCSYYMRTGLCRFGMTCKFNHPPDRKLVIAASRFKGEYPERVGQPECQYYLKTGTCKFGAMCKFHHPKEKVGVGGRFQLNKLGYPLRPNEVECAFYLRTGQCKFGSTCKFHHPQPSTVMAQFHGSHIYPSVNSPSSSQQSYTGTLSNWTMPRASFMPTPRWQTPSNYTPVILQQSFVPVAGWSAYPGQQSQQQAPTDGQIYDGTHQSEMPNTGATRPFSYHGGSSPMGLYGLQRENIFPERPGEPECQFYMKTGDCKFGAVCRFHHPKERYIPVPDCALSPLGLPLRPGEPLCAFYSRYGICKFGSNCKFDHPIGIFPYGVTSYSSGDVQVQNLIGTASETTQLTLLSQGSTDADAGILRRSSVPETTAVGIK